MRPIKLSRAEEREEERRRQSRSTVVHASSEEHEDDDDDEVVVSFTLSQIPASQSHGGKKPFEFSQSLPQPKNAEAQRLSNMSRERYSNAVTNLSRLLLFKALKGDYIDRRKCMEEAIENKQDRLTNALFDKAQSRLENVFGFIIRKAPNFMESSLPNKYRDRYYVINYSGDEDGSHATKLHGSKSFLKAPSVYCQERGLLMCILAFAFCKGTPIKAPSTALAPTSKKGGNQQQQDDNDQQHTAYLARWIKDDDLYRFLNELDSTIPVDPPRPETSKGLKSPDGKRRRSSTGTTAVSSSKRHDTGKWLDVEAAIDKFVSMDYLLKEKSESLFGNSASQDMNMAASEELEGFSYALGPRAALEIGRRQIIYFCADVLDEKPCDTMLAEVHDAGEMSEEE